SQTVGATELRRTIEVPGRVLNQTPIWVFPLFVRQTVNDGVGAVLGNLEHSSVFAVPATEGGAKQGTGCVQQQAGLRNRTVLTAREGVQDCEFTVGCEFEHDTAA